MTIEGEVMTIHQKIAQAHKRHLNENGLSKERPIKEMIAPALPDNVQIMQMLQYILDKLHTMDQYIRQDMQHKKHRTFESEAERAERVAKEMGLASPQQCMDALKKELDKYANDSQETDSGTREDTQQIAGGGSCPSRQGDFRAGDSSHTEMEHKGNDRIGTEKVNE
jgi:hypothetical protein